MAMAQVKERFFKSNSRENTQKVPFCQDVRDFIAESCKCQTLYANCEGFYPRRVASSQKKQLLKKFVFDFMYHSEDDKEQSQSISDRMIHATQICDEMISLSKNYNADGEIHFSVVWVYYFEYELRVIKAIPVFKIFTRKSGSEAVFLDILLKSYESWDSYLENAEFMESFLCVPRHGEYHFDHETHKLVLEYVRSMKLKTNDKLCLFYALPKAPFSQTLVRSLFSEITTFGGKMVAQIKRLLHILFSYLNDWKGPIFNAVILVICIWTKPKKFWNISSENIFSLAFTLLNWVIETSDCSNLLKLDYWTNHLATFTPEFSTLTDVQNCMRQVSSEGANFFELLCSPKKDWSEILKSFCFLFRNSRPILIAVSNIAPEFWIIRGLFWLLSIIEKISAEWSDSHELSKTENRSTKMKRDHENLNLEINSSGLPARYISSSSSKNVVQWKHVSYEEILSTLPSLETISSNAIRNLLFDKSSARFLEKVQPCSTYVSPANSKILVGKQDDYGIYLFNKMSVSELTWCIHRLLKTDFSFKPLGIFTTKILSCYGKTLGFIFFPSEFTAVGLFPLEFIEEEEENLLELVLDSQ